ncbi:MAG: MoaD/ThiS family protein [Gammaproteobacteria bacterium]|nr:MoaD/ThiS family protein [Gammaproteobacteria bacterium]
MPSVSFTPNLRRHVDCPTLTVSGETLSDALEQVFEANPRLRSYVLDDQGALRKHMVIFVDGAPARDRARLSDAVRGDSEIFVMQALSGG